MKRPHPLAIRSRSRRPWRSMICLALGLALSTGARQADESAAIRAEGCLEAIDFDGVTLDRGAFAESGEVGYARLVVFAHDPRDTTRTYLAIHQGERPPITTHRPLGDKLARILADWSRDGWSNGREFGLMTFALTLDALLGLEPAGNFDRFHVHGDALDDPDLLLAAVAEEDGRLVGRCLRGDSTFTIDVADPTRLESVIAACAAHDGVLEHVADGQRALVLIADDTVDLTLKTPWTPWAAKLINDGTDIPMDQLESARQQAVDRGIYDRFPTQQRLAHLLAEPAAPTQNAPQQDPFLWLLRP